MKKDTRPHDTLFKRKFSHKKAVEEFLRHRLAPELVSRLNVNTLTQKPDEFLPANYQGSKAVDVLWAVQTQEGQAIDFLLHFEGEGTAQQMAMRVLGYHAQIGETFLRQHPDQKLPTIITFVIYYGSQPWIGPQSIAAACRDFASQVAYGFQTDFMINLREASIAEILQDGAAASAELPLAGRAKGQLLQVLSQALGIEQEKCCEKSIIDYYLLLYADKEEHIFEEIAKFDPGKANDYTTMFHTLRDSLRDRLRDRLTIELKDKFLQQGVQQGKKEGKRAAIQELLGTGVLTPQQAGAALAKLS